MAGKNSGRIKFLLTVSLISAAVLLAVLVYKLDPAQSKLFPPCPFNKLTSFYCPGCGSLRATHQITHGNIFEAFKLNPLMLILMPFLAYSIGRQCCQVLFGKSSAQVIIRPLWIWVLLGIILCYWLARNIPLEPFKLLAPH